jgi:hypothetical protein
MAQVNLYVPDQLHRALLEEGTELNWSELFQNAATTALAGIKACPHRRLRCSDCGMTVDVGHA